MENNTITITIRNKIADIPLGEYLVSENTDQIIRFDFDSEWNACGAKTAHFSMGGWEFETPVVNGSVGVPRLPSGIREMSVGVVSGNISTTTAAVVPVYDSILQAAQATSIADAAEIARARAEAERIQAENERQANEAIRIANENARIASENARALAEQSRSSAESARAAAESARQTAESGRVSAEAGRASSEAARANAEHVRANAEALRDEHETARTSAESARQTAESARQTAENARQTAENARQTAETARAASESVRESNEIARINAETARATAETARAAAESDRAGAELDRIAAEQTREAQMAQFLSAVDAYQQAHDAFIVPYLVNEFGTSEAFKKFIAANAPISGLTRAVERFFTHAASVETGVYETDFEFPSNTYTAVSTKLNANSALVCEPSTNAYAGRDDYADLPLFACFDCNYTIDSVTLEPVIHAIKDVYGSFTSSPETSFVGVIQMTGWYRRRNVDNVRKLEYAAFRSDLGFKPLPEAVRTDGTVRPYVLHAKYAAGLNSRGMLSSISGVFCAGKHPGSIYNAPVTHDSAVELWRAWGSQYTGSSIADQAFCRLMLEIKYAELYGSKVMRGCRSYEYHYAAAVSETGVKRILLLPAQGTELRVGSTVTLGTSTDRTSSNSLSISDLTVITSIEDVTIDGESFKAINLDLASPVDITKSSTLILTQPWRTGMTDAVLGNDGSPYDNLSGKEPCKIQGIEIMLGAAEMLADTTARTQQGYYTVYMTRKAADIRAGYLGGVDPETLGTISKSGSLGKKYISDLSWNANDQEKYLLPASFGASYSTRYGDVQNHISANSSSSSYAGWAAFGTLESGAGAGFAGAWLSYMFTESDPFLTVRACGSAGSRGMFDPQYDR